MHAADALERSKKLKALSSNAQLTRIHRGTSFVNKTRVCIRLVRPVRPEPAVMPLRRSHPTTPADNHDANKHGVNGGHTHLQPPGSKRPVSKPHAHTHATPTARRVPCPIWRLPSGGPNYPCRPGRRHGREQVMSASAFAVAAAAAAAAVAAVPAAPDVKAPLEAAA